MSTRLRVSEAGGWEVDTDEVSPAARARIEFLRALELAAFRMMLDPHMNTARRQRALLSLLAKARASDIPELAYRAVERAVFDCVFGRPADGWYFRAVGEEIVSRQFPVRAAA